MTSTKTCGSSPGHGASCAPHDTAFEQLEFVLAQADKAAGAPNAQGAQSKGAREGVDHLICPTCGTAHVARTSQRQVELPVQTSAPRSSVEGLQEPESNVPFSQLPQKPARKAFALRGIEVFKLASVSAVLRCIDTDVGEADLRRRLQGILTQLVADGGMRPLVQPPIDWVVQIDAMRVDFPHLHEALDLIAPALAITAAGGIGRVPPLLLIGPPGIGKTYFATALGSLLGVPQVHMDMASATMGCTLSGLGPHWSNTATGEVFNTLIHGRGGHQAAANAVFFLDEVDKANGEPRFDPIGPLHRLLDSGSARTFEDEAIPGLTIDASHISWLLAANRVDAIPRPILSRCVAVHVLEPSRSQRVAIYSRIFADVVKAADLPRFNATITAATLEQLVDFHSPREFKSLCALAAGRAVMSGRQRVEAADFTGWKTTARNTVGFI